MEGYSKQLHDSIKLVLTRSLVALVASTAVVTAGFEGLSSTVYTDSAGVSTICYGETDLSHFNGKHNVTHQQCLTVLSKRLQGFAQGLEELELASEFKISPVQLLGVLDFSYNVGKARYNSSSVRKYLLKNDAVAASKAVLTYKYIHSKGKLIDCSKSSVCKGVWIRRQWQAKSIGNQYKSLYEACKASERVSKQGLEVCNNIQIAIKGVQDTLSNLKELDSTVK